MHKKLFLLTLSIITLNTVNADNYPQNYYPANNTQALNVGMMQSSNLININESPVKNKDVLYNLKNDTYRTLEEDTQGCYQFLSNERN